MKMHPPIVLVFAGNDPTGGAGLCADTQALISTGCHIAPVVTCITVQNTSNVLQNIPLPASQIAAQANAVLADMPIAACKIGLLGSVDIIRTVQTILKQYRHIPVILDPILAAGGGHSLSNQAIRQAILDLLLPLVNVLTPNSQEARILSGITGENLNQTAYYLLDKGCDYVCITGTHENTASVENTLYEQEKPLHTWTWERLPHTYHGSGCTFAASLAGFLAQGQDIVNATFAAQLYTWNCLKHGFIAGAGQRLPNRLFREELSLH